MTLHVERHGSGPHLVLLHGWALHSGVWGAARERLAERFTVTSIDLPGHGHSRHLTFQSQDDVARQIAPHIPEAATVLGWSLGGQVAMLLATSQPARVRRLVLLSSTPRFISGDDWSHGMRTSTLNDFAQRLASDYRSTLLNFLSLQVLGSQDARSHIALLRKDLFAHGEPASETLTDGLQALAHTDLRSVARDITQATLIMAGNRDALTPIGASTWLAENMRKTQMVRVADGAHALFLSHLDLFVDSVTAFAGSAT